MSYQVLARKWRPKKFQELMGQEHVVNVLTNALSQQRLHHAYLFTGTRGVGKTTIARIFAKSLNCEQGITEEPCGSCDACIDIDQGRFIDLLEIDAASRTKVDDTREILDNVQYAPSRGRYKVYLIDEVHMLSRSSFNALLKTLEEPPEHVKFILATTDPQKLPLTVLSRCLQFHLKALTVGQIKQQLNAILTAEKITFDDPSVALLAKAARGSMRDSLSLTDQAIAQGQGNIQFANVQQMLGGIDQHWPYKILIALVKQDRQGLMTLSLEMASYSPNYSRLLAELIQLLHQVAMTQVVGSHFDLSPDHEKLLHKFCKAMSPDDVQLYYQICLNGRKDLPYAIDEQAAFDMTLLRLAAFQPVTNVTALNNQTNQPAQIPNYSSKENNITFDDVELEESEVSIAEAVTAIHLPENNLSDSDNLISETQASEKQKNDTYESNTYEKDHTLNQQISELEGIAISQGMAREPIIELTEHNESPVPHASDSETALLNEDMFPTQENLAQEIIVQEGFIQENNISSQNIPNQETHHNVIPAENLAEKVSEQQVANEPSGSVFENITESSVLNVSTPKIGSASSAIQSVLATRNMLRSRKKQMERDGKKPDGAEPQRQKKSVSSLPTDQIVEQQIEAVKTEPVITQPLNNAPDLQAITEQDYQPDIIDPATIRSANQIDKWANMIDHMALNGRLRQLAIHATICQSSNDNNLVLLLDQSTKHLQTQQAHQQLAEAISNLLQRNVTVDIQVVEETVADPYKIQTDINKKRYEYAKELLKEDKAVQHLQNEFQAQLDEDSIVAK